MSLTFDLSFAVNLLLCVLILILGIRAFKLGKGKMPLLLGIAFGLFGLSHLANLLGLHDSLSKVLLIMRIFAYLLVVYIQYQIATTPQKKQEEKPAEN
ncbi:MAG TPA: hypothetical protein DHW42_07955 [Candidatus Marinimicrobia bacterium]|nr:hypothetical protein [Candidatus Neomarinimicrobiota bacterium]